MVCSINVYQAESEEAAPFHINEVAEEKSSSSLKLRKFLLASCFVALGVLSVFAVSVNPQLFGSAKMSTGGGGVSSLYSTSATFSLSVTLQTYEYPDSASMLPWDLIVEPYKPNTLSIQSLTLDDASILKDATVVWHINGETYDGISISVSPTYTGAYDCYVTAEVGSSTYIHYFTLASKYIRREIRTLTDNDRQRYLTALRALYTLSQDEGESLFGTKFVSAESLVYKHLNGAGTTDCDHWHDGAGIITHHSAYTLLAEQSLQAIDPSIAMPYWEYPLVSVMRTISSCLCVIV